MMIDLHAHILHGMDDGPGDMETSLRMLKAAAEDGITKIVATPHYVTGANRYDKDGLKCTFDQLADTARLSGLEIELLLGNELFMDEYIIGALNAGQCFTIAGTRYVLVELPLYRVPPYTERVLYDFINNGYKPILAHPERYAGVQADPNTLKAYIDMGCMVQLNATSINGAGGCRLQQVSRLLLEHNMAHIIASDCHSDIARPPLMTQAYKRVQGWLGKEKADRLFCQNPERVLMDQDIEIGMPIEIHTDSGLLERLKGCLNNIKQKAQEVSGIGE
jgi:protein-tyrosine phosphatase